MITPAQRAEIRRLFILFTEGSYGTLPGNREEHPMTKRSGVGQAMLEGRERVTHSGATLKQLFQDGRDGLRLLGRGARLRGDDGADPGARDRRDHDHLLDRRRGSAAAAVSGTAPSKHRYRATGRSGQG